MARIRTIKPDFWQHPKVTSVSRDARLYFLGLLNEADDEGRLRYSGKRLAGVIFPNDDDVNGPDVDAWTAELERVGLVLRYQVDGAPLLLVIGFTEHQKVSHPSPSRLPSPPESFANGSRTTPETFALEGNREQGREEEQGIGGSGSPTAPAPDPRIGQLIAGYIEDHGHDRDGHRPPGNWIAAAGPAIKRALADGETVEHIAACLGVIARESKNPSTLQHVLADMHAGKARR